MFFMANVRFACNKPIWKSKAPPRCKFFMWLVGHQRCLTADNLQRRGWPSNTTCPLCLAESENCTHLFVHCRFTQHLWRLFKLSTREHFITLDQNFNNTEDWWLKATSEVPKQACRNFDTVTILLHWRIWKELNARIFDQIASSADRVLDQVKEDLQVWRAAGCIIDLTA